MRPEWSKAPPWAKYIAMDRDGVWFWHENEPTLGSRDWQSMGQISFAGEDAFNWKTTMEERP